MNKTLALILAIVLLFAISACEKAEREAYTSSSEITDREMANESLTPAAENETTENVDMATLKMSIGNLTIPIEWEDNESVEALTELAANTPITVEMSMYGGFEQVGSLSASLPRNDVQTTTSAGDIVLYAGNQIVVFYGSNSWAYTRLGKIQNISDEELTNLLGNGNVTLTLSVA